MTVPHHAAHAVLQLAPMQSTALLFQTTNFSLRDHGISNLPFMCFTVVLSCRPV